MPIELTTRERDLVVELLSQELDELWPEIRHTDDRDYRGELRERRETVRHLIEHLQVPVPLM